MACYFCPYLHIHRSWPGTDVCLSAYGWRPRKSAAHTGRNLSPASLASGSKQITRPRHWPWTGACTAGHFIWEFHPVAKTAPIQVFSWSGFLPLCTRSPPHSHLLPTPPPSPPHSHPRTEWFMSHWGPFPLQSPSGLPASACSEGVILCLQLYRRFLWKLWQYYSYCGATSLPIEWGDGAWKGKSGNKYQQPKSLATIACFSQCGSYPQ